MTNCAVWYPVDTGLFVSASHDKSVKVGLLQALLVHAAGQGLSSSHALM